MANLSKHGYYTHQGGNVYKHSEKAGLFKYYHAKRTMVKIK